MEMENNHTPIVEFVDSEFLRDKFNAFRLAVQSNPTAFMSEAQRFRDVTIGYFCRQLNHLIGEVASGIASGGAVVLHRHVHETPASRPVKGAPTTSKATRAKGEKRPPHEIQRVTEQLFQAIKDNPGSRIEPIAKLLGYTTSELVLPAKKLIKDERIRTEGDRRSTRYFPKAAKTAKGKAKKKAAKKPTKKAKAPTKKASIEAQSTTTTAS